MKTYERHEGNGTGLDLTVEDALAEALAIVEPEERYYEFHRGRGTGLDLDGREVLRQAGSILETAWASLPAIEVPAGLPA